MSDLKQRIFDIIKDRQLAVLATVTEDGKPWARYVTPIATEDLTLRFATCVNARKVAQIQKNPEVHLTCGMADPMTSKNYLQIQGRAELTTDKAEREAVWFDHLKNIFQGGTDDPNYGVIIIEPYRIELCSTGNFSVEVWEA